MTADDSPPETPEEYADLGATTADAIDIATKSMDRVRELVPGETLADRIRQKAVHATGDPEFQHLIRFTGRAANTDASTGDSAVRAGATAIADGQPIVADITMVEAGITDRGHTCPVHIALTHDAGLAEETGMTRTAAGVLECDRAGLYDGAVAVIGNAPTAALTLADCIEAGTRPAVVVATPVGFVSAAKSRRRLRAVGTEYGVPTITNVGRRGGSGLAAALANELIHVATDREEDTV